MKQPRPRSTNRFLRLVREIATWSACMTLAACAVFAEPSRTGLNLMEAGRHQEAYDILSACAARGDPYCINNVGVMYDRSFMQGGLDVATAAEYYTLAARSRWRAMDLVEGAWRYVKDEQRQRTRDRSRLAG